LGSGYPCKGPSLPPSLVPQTYWGRKTFCVLRDPYDGMVAEFRRTAPRNQTSEECRAALNTYVYRMLFLVLGLDTGQSRPYVSGCRFLPQSAFIHGWLTKSEQVDQKQRWCSHPISHEQPAAQSNRILESLGLPQFQLAPRQQENMACGMLSKESLNESCRTLIEEAFREDFRLLGFDRMDRRPPAVRSLIVDARKVERGALVLRGVKTANEFELSFELTPISVLGHASGILALKGSGGNWMPGCLFVAGDTSLECIVGEAGSGSEDRCTAPSDAGLPLKRPSRVQVRLIGSTFTVQVDGRTVCVVQGVSQRQRGADGSVSDLWISESTGPGADATIASVQYKVRHSVAGLPAAPSAAPRVTRAPPSRILVGEGLQVKRSQRIASDIITAEDFEITFDLTVWRQANAEGLIQSIIQFTASDTAFGHQFDRMPALMLVGGARTLIAYMGHANNHNADCSASRQQPEGTSQQIVMRLEGTTFRISSEGKELCQIGRYTTKYGPVSGVRLMISDRFSEPAIARVENLVYRAGGQSGGADVWSPLAPENPNRR